MRSCLYNPVHFLSRSSTILRPEDDIAAASSTLYMPWERKADEAHILQYKTGGGPRGQREYSEVTNDMYTSRHLGAYLAYRERLISYFREQKLSSLICGNRRRNIKLIRNPK